ncbi:MAG: hypothetical protein M1837_003160 [Sclerophora amabilis]|nr:MAG: hypothetical protein M1837_003160 [Sclerophora amabilis]
MAQQQTVADTSIVGDGEDYDGLSSTAPHQVNPEDLHSDDGVNPNDDTLPLDSDPPDHSTILYAEAVTDGFLAMQSQNVPQVPNSFQSVATDFDRNIDFLRFVQQWVYRTNMPLDRFPFPRTSLRTDRVRLWTPPQEVLREHLDGERCDVQGMNWESFGVPRGMAMATQMETYGNYTSRGVYGGNVTTTRPNPCGSSLEAGPELFQFRSFRIQPRARLTHFQLRHLLSAASRYEVYYAGNARVFSYNGAHGGVEAVMDLTKRPYGMDKPEAMRIMCLSATDGVLVAGGYAGDYALLNLRSSAEPGPAPTRGVVSQADGITNHVHTSFGRSSTYPRAVFSSNDNKIRVLDCNTDTFIHKQEMEVAVNCAATSADGRWRVTVGDEIVATISDAETGRVCHRLEGHRDHGFACAWADDNVLVATASQERKVCIWDARNFSRPLTRIRSAIGAVRCLQFSPVGSGPRSLLMMEAAHTFSIVDARLFRQEQRCTQFGQLSGAGFTPEGDNIFIANSDPSVGGVMHYERGTITKQFDKRRSFDEEHDDHDNDNDDDDDDDDEDEDEDEDEDPSSSSRQPKPSGVRRTTTNPGLVL